jgi:hypothetical protein
MPPTPFSSKNPYNSANTSSQNNRILWQGVCDNWGVAGNAPTRWYILFFYGILFFMENDLLMRKTPFFANFIDFV